LEEPLASEECEARFVGGKLFKFVSKRGQ
jgi:hypothetical protein